MLTSLVKKKLIQPAPALLIPKCFETPGLLTHVVVSKYSDHLLLYWQESIFQRMNINIERNALAHWMIKVGNLF